MLFGFKVKSEQVSLLRKMAGDSAFLSLQQEVLILLNMSDEWDEALGTLVDLVTVRKAVSVD